MKKVISTEGYLFNRYFLQVNEYLLYTIDNGGLEIEETEKSYIVLYLTDKETESLLKFLISNYTGDLNKLTEDIK